MTKRRDDQFLRSLTLIFGLFIVVFITGVFFSRYKNPATSYLHSWNQVTTLVHIKLINEDYKNFWQPEDVVTRIGWSQESSSNDGKDSRFFIFEEFPLYHGFSSVLVRIFGTPEAAGRILSFIFFWLGLVGLFQLVAATEGRETAKIAALLYVTSFPFLYYGQSIMSDMAMTSMTIWGVYALYCLKSSEGFRAVALSALTFSIAGLCKSYAVIFALVLPLPSIVNRRGMRVILRDLVFFFLAVFPTLLWHFYAGRQVGAQETASHSFQAKKDVFLDISFYEHLLNIYLRYLGFGAGGLLLILFAIRFLGLIKFRVPLFVGEKGPFQLSSLQIPAWIWGWLGVSFLYLLFTADKLKNHDYYFLPVFPPILCLAAKAIFSLYNTLQPDYGRIARSLLVVVFLVNGIVVGRSLLKATTPNEDVIRCAALIQSFTSPDELIATMSDLSRYNSLSFYSGRRGVNVEQSGYSLADYYNFGARYFVVNLPTHEYRNISIQDGPRVTRSLMIEETFEDFKGRVRVCGVFRLSGNSPKKER